MTTRQDFRKNNTFYVIPYSVLYPSPESLQTWDEPADD